MSTVPRQRGVTLIELMIALVIGMALSLAMFAVITTAEGRKRTLTVVNDTNQAGNYALQLIEQWVRSAGTGFVQAAPYALGCTLRASQVSPLTGASVQILPTLGGAALPAPFGNVTEGTLGTFRLAPILILPNQTKPISGNVNSKSDVLVIMAGAAGLGELPTEFSTFATDAQLNLLNTVPFSGDDMVLAVPFEPAASTSQVADCLIDQVDSSFTGTAASALPMAGDYHVAGSALATLSDNSVAMSLGNVVKGKPPFFQVIGVGDNNVLYSYDLLNTTQDSTRAALARADGVFELHALYGIDVDCDGKISGNEWFNPTNTTYSVAAFMAGTMLEAQKRPIDAAARHTKCSTLTTANDLLQKILAVRVGLILRTNTPEKAAVTTTDSNKTNRQTVMGTSTQDNITLFSHLDAATVHPAEAVTYTRPLTSDEKLYRYRTVETTIPVRNGMMLPTASPLP